MGDREALLDLLRCTGGPQGWTSSFGWGSPRPIGEWFGVAAKRIQGEVRVVGLELAGNGLTGRLPESIGRMTWLKTLHLQNNHLEGPIPIEIRQLLLLNSLKLEHNNFDFGSPSDRLPVFQQMQWINDVYGSPGDSRSRLGSVGSAGYYSSEAGGSDQGSESESDDDHFPRRLIDVPGVSFGGWVLKRGGSCFGNWHLRFILLYASTLQLYKREPLLENGEIRTIPYKYVDLDPACRVEQVFDNMNGFSVDTGEKCYYFRAESVDDKYTWMMAIYRAISETVSVASDGDGEERDVSDEESIVNVDEPDLDIALADIDLHYNNDGNSEIDELEHNLVDEGPLGNNEIYQNVYDVQTMYDNRPIVNSRTSANASPIRPTSIPGSPAKVVYKAPPSPLRFMNRTNSSNSNQSNNSASGLNLTNATGIDETNPTSTSQPGTPARLNISSRLKLSSQNLSEMNISNGNAPSPLKPKSRSSKSSGSLTIDDGDFIDSPDRRFGTAGVSLLGNSDGSESDITLDLPSSDDDDNESMLLKWSCPQCTYLNSKKRKSCKLCDTSKNVESNTNKNLYGSLAGASPHFDYLSHAFAGGDPQCIPYEVLETWTDKFCEVSDSDSFGQIGRGAFGSVYKGLARVDATVVSVDEISGEEKSFVRRVEWPIAVKRMRASTTKSASALGSLRRELAVLSSFKHPHIVRLVGYYSPEKVGRDSYLCLVYELLPLGGLDTIIENDSLAAELSLARRLKILIGVASALNFMHNRDPKNPAYHRDIKSANIALASDYTAKLIDCGLAKYAAGESENTAAASSAGGRFGTPGYMCPSYCQGEVYDERCDIFSFGIVILEMLTGRLQGKPEVAGGRKLFLQERVDKISVDRRISSQYSDIVDKGLRNIASEATQPYDERVPHVILILQRLRHLESSYVKPYSSPTLEQSSVVPATNHSNLNTPQGDAITKSLSNTKKCLICYDEVQIDDGIECYHPSSKHFTCNPCFSDFIISQCSPENRGVFHQHGGNVVCSLCFPSSVTAFRLRDIVLHVSADVADLYSKAKDEVIAARVCIEEQAKFQRQLEDTKKMIKTAQTNLGLQRHRRYIVENFLNLLCPRCRTPFVDFDGCFALNCTFCNCKFCAWCLNDCGPTVSFSGHHRHVMNCPQAPPHRHDSYSGTLEEFNQVQNKRRLKLITEYIEENIRSENMRIKLKEVIEGDLRDLGIILPL